MQLGGHFIPSVSNILSNPFESWYPRPKLVQTPQSFELAPSSRQTLQLVDAS